MRKIWRKERIDIYIHLVTYTIALTDHAI